MGKFSEPGVFPAIYDNNVTNLVGTIGLKV
jgi:hypothetical protein